jgi:site-specific DNA-methyltransferase (adenine-specific)/site-specific DNA-methyltransferase (cytosine-N4-specific)
MSQIIHGDCLDVLRTFPDSSANLIVTSPPYANQRKGSYGGIDPKKYVSWFMPRADEFMRVLTLDGSMILNICPHIDSVVSSYVDELANELRYYWFHKATYWWRKTSSVPGKAAYRLRNAVEPCYHFAVQNRPAFYSEQVKQPATARSIQRHNRLADADLEQRQSATGSGTGINMDRTCRNYGRKYRQTGSGISFVDTPNSFCDANGMVYPDNVIEAAPEFRNLQRLYGDPRFDDDPKASAPFPEAIPAYFINLMTRRGDTVLDPFAGSGTTAVVTQKLCRNYIAIEKEEANVALIRNRLQDKKRSRL